ncbi:hypothetical protein LTR84_007957 [Exophiala bonariae]|uniref:Uncharacterized protein n=1 Tax=Exophiala bonariae TaxID=1690606 RepID=A0AAV9NQC1_9EURO|nr:hypothetical protein LTR84_007957 [Exophiala bonariae]
MEDSEHSLKRLERISPEAKWSHFDPVSEAVTITNAIWDFRGKGGSSPISDSSRMALALTEACCAQGSGKVFLVHPHRAAPLRNEKALIEARVALSRVPSLFYIHTTWSDGERLRWNSMKPIDRLAALTSRYGMVPQHMSVLPLDVELASDVSQVPTLNGLKTGSVTILLTSAAYIGPTLAMRRECGEVNAGSLSFQCLSGWASFDQWRQTNGLAGVVRRLEDLYHDVNSKLCFFVELQRRLVLANMKAASEGEAYHLVQKELHVSEEEADEDGGD